MTTHRKNGTFRKGNKAARLGKANRVVLPAQRVAPETLATLRDYGSDMGGVGRAIDAAAAALRDCEARMAAALRARGR